MSKEGIHSSVQDIAKYYNKIDGHYDDLYSSPVCLAEDNIVMSQIKPHIGENSHLLDIGCGTGLVASHLEGVDFKGIDVSSTELETAVEKVPSHKNDFMVGDMNNIPFKDGSFSILTSTYGPFSYSQDPESLREELMRVIKPGSKFVVMPYSKRTGMSIGMGGSTAAVDGNVPRIYYTEDRIKTIFNGENEKVSGINYLANLVMEELESSRQEFVIDKTFLMNELKYLVNRMGEEHFMLPEEVNFGRLPELWSEFQKDRNNVDIMTEILEEERKVFEGVLPAHFARHMLVTGTKK